MIFIIGTIMIVADFSSHIANLNAVGTEYDAILMFKNLVTHPVFYIFLLISSLGIFSITYHVVRALIVLPIKLLSGVYGIFKSFKDIVLTDDKGQ